MMQFRSATDHRMFAPNRDCAQHGPRLLRRVVHSFTEDSFESWTKEFMQAAGVTLADIGVAVQFMAKVQVLLYEVRIPDLRTAMLEAGVESVKPAALALVYQRIGERQFGCIWLGLRDITDAEAAPPVEMEALVTAADEAAAHLRRPAWRRWLERGLFRFRKWLRRKLGVPDYAPTKVGKSAAPVSNGVAGPAAPRHVPDGGAGHDGSGG